MCCLFGMIDYGNSLTGKQKSRLLSVLATECEARGTDATGIAYNSGGKLRIYKRPLPGHKMRFRIPDETAVIMGHTRLTTQGDAKKNRNNHPFSSNALNRPFAVAHNGVLYNDTFLRKSLKLPATDIETDSYIAVQLIERQKALNFNSLKTMAEAVEGSFCFTVLDGDDSLYFVKGDNPMCIYHYPRLGLYLYASTEEILRKAVQYSPYALGKETQVRLHCGDILQIGADGQQTKSSFNADDLFYGAYFRGSHIPQCGYSWKPEERTEEEDEYIQHLKTAAACCGYDEEAVDMWLMEGFTTDEIEEYLYCGEV